MVDVAQVDAFAFGAVLGGGFEVDVQEEVVLLAEAPQRARADADDLFLFAAGVGAVGLALGDLAESVAVEADAQVFGDDFIFGGEVGVEGLARLGVFDAEVGGGVGVAVLGVPEVVEAAGEGPLRRDEPGGGPIGIEADGVGAGIDGARFLVVAGGEDGLKFDAVGEDGALFALDDPLEVGADEEVAEAIVGGQGGAIGFEAKSAAGKMRSRPRLAPPSTAVGCW